MADILPFRPGRRPAADRAAPAQRPDLGDLAEETSRIITDAIDRLLAILDRIDVDPDLEDGGDDEPSLGAPEEFGNTVVWFRGTARDLEMDQQAETEPPAVPARAARPRRIRRRSLTTAPETTR